MNYEIAYDTVMKSSGGGGVGGASTAPKVLIC